MLYIKDWGWTWLINILFPKAPLWAGFSLQCWVPATHNIMHKSTEVQCWSHLIWKPSSTCLPCLPLGFCEGISFLQQWLSFHHTPIKPSFVVCMAYSYPVDRRSHLRGGSFQLLQTPHRHFGFFSEWSFPCLVCQFSWISFPWQISGRVIVFPVSSDGFNAALWDLQSLEYFILPIPCSEVPMNVYPWPVWRLGWSSWGCLFSITLRHNLVPSSVGGVYIEIIGLILLKRGLMHSQLIMNIHYNIATSL